MTPSPEEDERARHIENLRAVYQSMRHGRAPADGSATVGATTGAGVERNANSDRASASSGSKPGASHRGRNSALGAAGATLAALAGKVKLLGVLAGVLKFKTLGTMLLSVALYATQWGWRFAFGFVLLILVHEMGHAIAMRREGIPAGAPVFIPFLGAFIAMRGRPRDAHVEAMVAMAGPVAGSLAAWAVLATGLVFQHPQLVALGHVGVLINLFNLIPVSPLDGGRIAGAFTRSFWVAGYALGVVALILLRSPLLFLVLLVGLFTLWQRWRHPVPGYDAIPRSRRLATALGYAALVLALVATLPLGREA